MLLKFLTTTPLQRFLLLFILLLLFIIDPDLKLKKRRNDKYGLFGLSYSVRLLHFVQIFTVHSWIGTKPYVLNILPFLTALFSFAVTEICGLVWGLQSQPLSSEFQSLFERSQTNSQLFVVGCCKRTTALWGVECSDVCLTVCRFADWENMRIFNLFTSIWGLFCDRIIFFKIRLTWYFKFDSFALVLMWLCRANNGTSSL